MDPDRFLGKPDEYLLWAKLNNKFNPYFCPRHWMPCPVEGKPGILASVILMRESFAFLPESVTDSRDFASAANSWLANQTVSICCRLGDEKMAWLWWLVDLDRTKLCGAQSVRRGERVCWRPKDHSGEHEWERSYPRSTFDLMAELQPEQ